LLIIIIKLTALFVQSRSKNKFVSRKAKATNQKRIRH
jgi:hypothetical protein